MHEYRFAEAYLQMATIAKYRPAAPGDGLGNLYLSQDELEDKGLLMEEAVEYARRFAQEDEDLRFDVGCSKYDGCRALVYIIEAARSICATNDKLAVKLLKMAIKEIDRNADDN
jgi:hypothetical protein